MAKVQSRDIVGNTEWRLVHPANNADWNTRGVKEGAVGQTPVGQGLPDPWQPVEAHPLGRMGIPLPSSINSACLLTSSQGLALPAIFLPPILSREEANGEKTRISCLCQTLSLAPPTVGLPALKPTSSKRHSTTCTQSLYPESGCLGLLKVNPVPFNLARHLQACNYREAWKYTRSCLILSQQLSRIQARVSPRPIWR